MKYYLFSREIVTIFGLLMTAWVLYGCKPSINSKSDAMNYFYSEDTLKVILKHQSSKLSDQELRDLWTKAGVERLTQLKDFEKKQNEYRLIRAENNTRCEDIAFKTKNAEKCSEAAVTPIGMSLGPIVNSQQDIFNGYLLGACNWGGIEKSREIGCFPNGYTPTFITAKEVEETRLRQLQMQLQIEKN